MGICYLQIIFLALDQTHFRTLVYVKIMPFESVAFSMVIRKEQENLISSRTYTKQMLYYIYEFIHLMHNYGRITLPPPSPTQSPPSRHQPPPTPTPQS